jgi:hypothetical protein
MNTRITEGASHDHEDVQKASLGIMIAAILVGFALYVWAQILSGHDAQLMKHYGGEKAPRVTHEQHSY